MALRTSDMSAADLLSSLIVILAWRNVQSAEIEASYMWGLTDHGFLVGDSRYFLMTLSSAVERLKVVRNTVENMSLGHRSVSIVQQMEVLLAYYYYTLGCIVHKG